jgi:hypothetical protein
MVVVEPGAVADAVNVIVAEHVGLQLAGVKALAVTPMGRTVRTLKVTGVVVPEESVVEAVSIPPKPPPVIVKLAGVAARLKSNAATTTRVKVATRVTTGEPPAAWTVTTVEDAPVPAAAVNVTVAEQVGLQLAGENTEAVTPGGSVVGTLNVTGAVVPEVKVALAVST